MESQFDIEPTAEKLEETATPPEWKRFFAVHPALKKWVPVIAISILSSIAVVAVGALLLWYNRDRIAQAILPVSTTPSAAATNVDLQVPASETTVAPKELSVTDVVARVNPSVVSIEVSQQVSARIVDPFGGAFPGFTIQQPSTEPRVVGKGTGFFVTSDGYIITNRHVIDFPNATYTVSTSKGKRLSATLIAKDPVFDIAVLKVSASGYPAVTLGNSDKLELGQSVVAIGFALGQFQNSISVGVVSGLSRSIVAGGLGGGTEQLDRVIQTDAAINPGNSGGPLIDLHGEVIGVNVATAVSGQSISFAVPSNNVRQVVDSVKRTGTIVRPYVGIQYAQIDDAMKAASNLPVAYGVLVQQVVPKTPADLAGIVRGDIIVSLDGVTLDGDPSFATIIRSKSVGATVLVRVLKTNGTQTTIPIKLAQAPNN